MMIDTPENHPLPAACIAVCIAVWRDGMVLLVRRGREPNKNLWALPGGKVDLGETIAEAAKRELHEETSLRAEPHTLFHVKKIIDAGFQYVLHCVSAANPAGALRAGDDVAEARWISPGELATLNTVPGLADIIQRSQTGSAPVL